MKNSIFKLVMGVLEMPETRTGRIFSTRTRRENNEMTDVGGNGATGRVARAMGVMLLCFFGFAITQAQPPAQPTGTFNLATATWTSGSGNATWNSSRLLLLVENNANIIVTGSVDNGRRVDVAANATARITLSNCTINIPTNSANEHRCAIYLENNANLTLTLAGNNTLRGGNYAAGIGVFTGRSLTIEGTGSLTVTGGTSGGAGIGGFRYNNQFHAGTIIINNGTINATGRGGGAGIGGGCHINSNFGGNGGTITINNGTINATGNDGGAGIGGGRGGVTSFGSSYFPFPGGDGGVITINNGTINSIGNGGAGIGGGMGAANIYSSGAGGGGGGTINIRNGMVKATGNLGAAGIGGGSGGFGGPGGNGGNGGTLNILNGSVDAMSTTSSGIGGGSAGLGGTGGSNGNPTTFTMNGNAIIFASSISVNAASNFTRGILFQNTNGSVSGSVELANNLTIPTNYKLTIIGSPQALTNPNGRTITNNGTISIENGGTLTNWGTLTNTAGIITVLNSNSTLVNWNTITGGARINNNGTVRNSGTIDGTPTGNQVIVHLPTPTLTYRNHGKIAVSWNTLTDWPAAAGNISVEISGTGFFYSWLSEINFGTAGLMPDIPENMMNRTFTATIRRPSFTSSISTSIAPVFLPYSPRIEYGDCRNLKVFWDVLEGTQWAGAGEVRIVLLMNGELVSTSWFPYNEGTTNGGNIFLPENTFSGAENPEYKTFTATLLRVPFNERETTTTSILNTSYLDVSTSNIKTTGIRSFDVDWQFDDGYACDYWYYNIVVSQDGIEEPYRTHDFLLSDNRKTSITLPDGFNPCETLNITLELYEDKVNLIRVAEISGSFVLIEVDARYQIGSIPNQTVWHEGNRVVPFYVAADEFECDNVTFGTVYPTDKNIMFNISTGRFIYFPDKTDVRDFVVTFTAEAEDGRTITQDVTFRMMPSIPPEFVVFGDDRPMPSVDEFRIFTQNILPVTQQFNTGTRIVRTVSVSGKELNSDYLRTFNNNNDILELTLYAEKVTISEPLRFFQTNVTIYAKQLVFEGNGSINTSPVAWQGLSSTPGNNGERAGNITLHIKEFEQTSLQTRFYQTGGKGQDTQGSNIVPGNGGNGGKLTSTIDVSAFSDLRYGGSPGIQFLSASNNQVLSVGERGSIGVYENVSEEFTWLHPNWVSAVVKYANDAYLNQHNVYALGLYSEYLQAIENFSASIVPAELTEEDFVKFKELNNSYSEMQSSMMRLSQDLDYFGNPFGWVPMLSFEIAKFAFDLEIDRAIPVLYLHYWMNRISTLNDLTLNDFGSALEMIRQELIANKGIINYLVSSINDLLFDALDMQTNLESIIVRIEEKRLELLEILYNSPRPIEYKIEKAEWMNTTVTVLNGIATVTPIISLFGPVGKVVGTVSTALAKGGGYLFKQLYDSSGNVIEIEGFIDTTNSFLNSDVFTNIKNAAGGINIPEIGSSTEQILNFFNLTEDLYRGISQEIIPFISDVENIYKVIAGSSVLNDQIQAELNQISAESSEFRELVNELRSLNDSKLSFMISLQDFIDRFTTASVSVQNCIAAADGLGRRILNNQHNSANNHQVMQYVDNMNRNAEERLIKYHYYMAKSYEYRLLDTYTQPLDPRRNIKQLINIATAGNDILTSEQFASVVRPAYVSMLSNMSTEILGKFFLGGNQEFSIDETISLTQNELDELNTGNVIILNILERSGIPLREENIRITNFGFRDNLNDIVVSLPAGGYGRFDLDFVHSGMSMLRSKGQMYWFEHRSSQFGNPFLWRFTHDTRTGTTPHGLSDGTQSLLYSLLNNQNSNIMIFSRPGALADISISKKDREGSSENIIEELTFELNYDYVLRDDRDCNLDIYAADVEGLNKVLTPYIEISQPDLSQRSDGRTPMYRTYRNNSNITLTAPEEYGLYEFENWMNRFDSTVITTELMLPVIFSNDMDLVLIANYKYVGPSLLVDIDTVFISPFAGVNNEIEVKNRGKFYIDWEAESNNDWLVITVGEGTNTGNIVFEYEDNPLKTYRIGSIKIISQETGEEKTIIVKQFGSAVIDVSISPDVVLVGKGDIVQFEAIVEVEGVATQDVTWSISGHDLTATRISETGLLSVAPNETAESIIVTATSVFDNDKKGTANVIIESNIIVYYSVTVTSDDGGSVEIVGYENLTEEFEAGTTITVKATPNVNHDFINWTNTESGESIHSFPVYSFTVTEDITLTAHFKLTGIKSTEISHFTIFPNPTNNKLTVVRSSIGISQIEIYTSDGLQVITQVVEEGETESDIDVSSLSSGVYLIRLIDEQNNSVQRFVISY